MYLLTISTSFEKAYQLIFTPNFQLIIKLIISPINIVAIYKYIFSILPPSPLTLRNGN